MDLILQRYRNLTILLVVIAAQLVLIAYQVKSNQDMTLLRVWSVTAVTPLARLIEMVRGSTTGFVRDYFILLNAREENQRLKEELQRIKLENHFLRSELSTAERARALAAFQERIPSRTIGARIIANSTGANSKVVYIDRGSVSGVRPGMGVITPDGIVGKIIAVYPTASQVMLITDPSFAAGVISEKARVHGTLKGQGHGTLIMDYVPTELRVEVGEKIFTSGDDRIFPKGLPVGEVKLVRPGRAFKEIYVAPSGFSQSLEEVLVVVEGVHQIDFYKPAENLTYHLLPSPPKSELERQPRAVAGDELTDADRIRSEIRQSMEAQGVVLGQGGRIPNFNVLPAPVQKALPPASSGDPNPGVSASPLANPATATPSLAESAPSQTAASPASAEPDPYSRRSANPSTTTLSPPARRPTVTEPSPTPSSAPRPAAGETPHPPR
ncbi:MAG: rod shape-determining protein MreC [Bryobacteraceae bacterium]|nr:rod shape-determining protein MreC [Bryobacteraceae bacterium]MDW8376649.1 rod shape-determining protein MreC [Bryobacterales bacterium]